MNNLRLLPTAALLCMFSGHGSAQDLATLNNQWGQTINAVQHGDDAAARAALARFTATATSYVRANGRSWKIEYLVGSLDCMFPDKRRNGAEFLTDILENNRTLNQAGEAELRRQLAVCSGPVRTTPSSTQPDTPPDVNEVSTHYQAVGVSGNMKGGGSLSWKQESAAAASPIPAGELAARLVTVDDPEKALEGALRRLPAGAKGAAVEGFAVVTVDGSPLQAQHTGACLKQYAEPLKEEFQIASSQYMVTAYSVPDGNGVYQYAERLHGLDLPLGVIAYSVPDDMSLVSTDAGQSCGSMAHELVHLLIKQSFPGAPAWLEEGLASEVAIANPSPQSLRFGWSWRDQTLLRHYDEVPTVSDLLKMPWSALSAYHQSDARNAEAHQAMAAVFIRYLDSRGKLRDVYFRARDQHVSMDLSGVRSYQSIVEQELGMPVSAIDADFKRWFRAQAAAHSLAESPAVLPPPQTGAPHSTYGGAMNAAPKSKTGCSRVNAANDPPDASQACTPNQQLDPNAPATPAVQVTPNAPGTPNAPASPQQ